MNSSGEIRCPGCGRLLAKRVTTGAAVVKQGKRGERQLVLIRDGQVVCAKCDHIVDIWPNVSNVHHDPKGRREGR